MISVQDLESLGKFWADEGDAISFYLQPPIPSELAHREEPILAKDKIREALGGHHASSSTVRADLNRLQEMAAAMKGNSRETKIVFACGRQQFWQEYNCQGDFGVRLEISHSFSLAPLTGQVTKRPCYCIALADMNRARLLLFEAGKISEHSQVLDEEKEKIRTTGTKSSVSAQRQKDELVRKHFQFLADHLLHFYEHGDFDNLLVGCRTEIWPEIEAVLHSELKRILLAHFHVDPGLASPHEVQERAQQLIDEKDREDENALVQTVTGEAARDGLGAVGLSPVARSLEKGEIRTLMWTNKNGASPRGASICLQCGHLRLGTAQNCDLCRGPVHQFPDAKEALVRKAIENSIELRVLETVQTPLPDDIGALLRFRSDHNTAQAEAAEPAA
ncbi:MAG TPA: hypothetical protein VFA74_18185 [Terriglobales bacterium]|nr:hypothetical protein [Terriglobales bacterium]